MQQFISLLKKLTKVIQEDKTLDANSFDLLSLVAIDSDSILQLREETSGQKVSNIDEFWDLTEEIYKNLMLKTIIPGLQEYCKEIQYNTDQKWLKIVYTFSPWDKFLVRIDNDRDLQVQQRVISIEPAYAENQIASFLDFFQIDDANWYDDLYDFDYAFNFQSQIESLFHDLVCSCWQEVKTKTGATIIGFIEESNGGSYIFNLDTGESLHELGMSMEEYISNKRL